MLSERLEHTRLFHMPYGTCYFAATQRRPRTMRRSVRVAYTPDDDDVLLFAAPAVTTMPLPAARYAMTTAQEKRGNSIPGDAATSATTVNTGDVTGGARNKCSKMR